MIIKFYSPVTHRVRSFCYAEAITLNNKYMVQISNKTCNVRVTSIVPCSRNHYCSEKAIVITYSECVFLALGIQHAMRMGIIILSSVTCRLYSIFSHLMIGMIFEKKKLNIKHIYWFSVQLVSETFLILRRTERDLIKYVRWSLCKVSVILVRF